MAVSTYEKIKPPKTAAVIAWSQQEHLDAVALSTKRRKTGELATAVAQGALSRPCRGELGQVFSRFFEKNIEKCRRDYSCVFGVVCVCCCVCVCSLFDRSKADIFSDGIIEIWSKTEEHTLRISSYRSNCYRMMFGEILS